MVLEHRAVVDAPPDRVFALTQDYARRLEWDPFLRRAELAGGATAAGVGVRAWCVSRAGFGMETEYVTFAPPRIAAVKMTRGPWFLRTFGGAWELSPVPDGGTEISFRYQFHLRPAWFAWALEPLARGWFSWETKRRVAALRGIFTATRTTGETP